MFEPEYDSSGESDSAEEVVCAAVVARGDPALILQPAEHDLDTVALAIECGALWD